MNIVSDFAKDKKENGGEGFYEDISERGRSEEKNMGEKLCIDDKNLQGEGVIILSNPEKNKPIAIMPGTKARDAINYLQTYIPEKLRLEVKQVSLDMGRNMEQIVRECFPNSILVTDRFHVMKNILEDLGAIRTRCKTVLKKKALDEEKRAKECGKKYRQERYMTGETEIETATRLARQLRKRRLNWNRSQERRWKIACQIEELGEVISGYKHVEDLWVIYDDYEGKTVSKDRLEKRLGKGDELGGDVLEISNMTRMLRRRLDSISNYFVNRHTNGYAEGLNSRIQRLISMTRGFSNRDYLYYRIVKMFS